MQHHVVQYTPKRVFCVFIHDGLFHRFAYGNPQAPRRIGICCENLTAGLGFIARAGHTVGSPGLHHEAAIRFLVEADLHHEYLQLQSEKGTCHGKSASPLSRTGLRADLFCSGDLVVIGLWNGRIGFMASRGTYPFILVVYLGRCLKIFFQLIGPVKRCRTPYEIFFKDRFWDIYPSLLAYLLFYKGHGKDGSQVLGSYRLTCSRVKRRFHRRGHIRHDVVPLTRHFRLGQYNLFGFHGRSFFPIRLWFLSVVRCTAAWDQNGFSFLYQPGIL